AGGGVPPPEAPPRARQRSLRSRQSRARRAARRRYASSPAALRAPPGPRPGRSRQLGGPASDPPTSGCPLKDRRDALAAADAHRFQSVASVAPHQFAGQVGEDASTSRADRMAERDARAIDVEHLVAAVVVAPAPALYTCEHL